MGYIIEVSFNLWKYKNVSELEEMVISTAKDCLCDFYYSHCEMEKNLSIQRNHMVITVNFDQTNIDSLLCFLKKIKKIKEIYLESIFNEETNGLIYASHYYRTTMDKSLSRNYQSTKRERSYSEDETMILKEIQKRNRSFTW